MYHCLLQRQREHLTQCMQFLRDYGPEMSLDPRFYHHIGHLAGPGSQSSASSSGASAITGITSPSALSMTASAASMRSTASSPSLRARESVAIATHRADGVSSPSAGGGGNVRVVVRVRKFLPREIDRKAKCLISMDPHTQMTRLRAPQNPEDEGKPKSQARGKVLEDKSFIFDNSFWSHNEKDGHYAHQEDVYNCLGEEFLDHNFEGYHTCIFAYGQTGSGKSYTMMGTADQPGLIPRTCEDLFQRIETAETPNVSFNVRVSYFEVYNEHVRDLLVPRTDPPHYLRIRESPLEGPYVKDLTEVTAKSYDEIMKFMRKGDMSRTVASTKMNDTSSRSHAVFTITLKQIHHDLSTDETTERTARIRLVDLAGSERAKSTEATGQRLREGSNINKSLTTLGRVIAALADPKPGRPGKRKVKDVVPYRDSILTWLLKDSLGGNSKTAMIACISPSDYDETLSTLRYADQAKRIRTRARVNQDHLSAAERDKQIAEMAETIRTLQLSVSLATANRRENENQNERLEEYQQKVEKLQRLMEETKMVSECKIRQLQTENEAMRNHLKLALDSIRNPIPPVIVPKRRDSRFSVDESDGSLTCRKQSRALSPPSDLDSEPEPDLIWEDEDTIESDSSHFEAQEMQAHMENLLDDLNMFKRKLATDHERFRPSLPLDGRKRRRALGDVWANNR
ncbi:kinesin-domain-containing protein [Aspergillus heteromorphus CBS 117.55]|uniref:Kinesin-like protein n=1 Tax=Aspergillus heteromorphus CBS 117.55 TaxID=1448321 RepID=A0A317UWQ4_9EURO|nr:kinesin-domain-containing protein [Aspergillus heteromorphus CBS 117.55]PWY66115.1 kinesin-domain-containing protein [Aspergillus heteromorphus CBS 117.55]